MHRTKPDRQLRGGCCAAPAFGYQKQIGFCRELRPKTVMCPWAAAPLCLRPSPHCGPHGVLRSSLTWSPGFPGVGVGVTGRS